MIRYCAWCGESLINRTSRAKFCNSTCKARHWDAVQAEEPTIYRPMVFWSGYYDYVRPRASRRSSTRVD